MSEPSTGTLEGIRVKRMQTASLRYGGLALGVVAGMIAGGLGVLPRANVARLVMACIALAAFSLLAARLGDRVERRAQLQGLVLAVHLVEIPVYTYILHLCGGFQASYLVLVYAAVILVSGVSGRPFFGYVTAALSSLCYGSLVLFEFVGWIPRHGIFSSTPSPGNLQAMVAGAIISLFFVLALAAATTSKRLRHSRRLLREQARELSREIDEKRLAVAEAQQAESNLQAILEQATDVIFVKDLDGHYTLMNPAGAALFGRDPEEIEGLTDRELFREEEARQIRLMDDDIVDSGKPHTYEHSRLFGDEERRFQTTKIPNRRPDGRVVGLIGISRDVTEDRRIQQEVENSLLEKEALLREIHHRVKNNLQVISSLLAMKARTADNEEARATLQDSRARVRSMASVHELLYQEQDQGSIQMERYLERLVEEVLRIHQVGPGPSFDIRIDCMRLDLDSAIPCGLIVSELVVNSLRHAFPADRQGRFEVGLRRLDAHRAELWVSDDGVGMPEEPLQGAIGLQLVTSFARQIGGELSILEAEGTRIQIVFPTAAV